MALSAFFTCIFCLCRAPLKPLNPTVPLNAVHCDFHSAPNFPPFGLPSERSVSLSGDCSRVKVQDGERLVSDKFFPTATLRSVFIPEPTMKLLKVLSTEEEERELEKANAEEGGDNKNEEKKATTLSSDIVSETSSTQVHRHTRQSSLKGIPVNKRSFQLHLLANNTDPLKFQTQDLNDFYLLFYALKAVCATPKEKLAYYACVLGIGS